MPPLKFDPTAMTDPMCPHLFPGKDRSFLQQHLGEPVDNVGRSKMDHGINPTALLVSISHLL
jgi:hypothetical protein